MMDGVASAAPTKLPCSFVDDVQKPLDGIPFVQRSPYETGDWKKVQTLGKALFGKVYLTRINPSCQLGIRSEAAAVKMIPKQHILEHHRLPGLENPANEIHAALAVRGFNDSRLVAEIYGVYQDPTHVYIVSEYVSKGELFTLIQTSPGLRTEAKCRSFAIQMLTVARDLHHHGIVHRDFSLENFLLCEDSSLRLIDFGQAIRVGADDASIRVDSRGLPGKPPYVPPELKRAWYSKGNAIDEFYSGMKLDMFQIGVAIFAALCGNYPVNDLGSFKWLYPDADASSDRCQKLSRMIAAWCPGKLSPQCCDLLEQLLAPNPSSRPSASEALQHQWLHKDEPSEVVQTPSDTPMATAVTTPFLSRKSNELPRPSAADEVDARPSCGNPAAAPLLCRSYDTPYREESTCSATRDESIPIAGSTYGSPRSCDTPSPSRSQENKASSSKVPFLSQRSYDIPHDTDANCEARDSEFAHAREASSSLLPFKSARSCDISDPSSGGSRNCESNGGSEPLSLVS